ncbi:MAG: 4-hydroxythreonine-4-phosphate dehydrogenase PdxA [Pyrinomonadaceae bacterium]|nr:4-hydroxythreonine-4-phosphate dehydrogenase PdxA [Pyrinomonadaceae bacterium]MCX7639784.1 4-hydroxythreonine-4-phosphate dehydrogenase PdxA [Pyrinomonadaceae bacterium]MDW8304367.1 4-hydroxythreonine-4-phosphate dehydrogenase PdxA [Acidobacteriota bacterium]
MRKTDLSSLKEAAPRVAITMGDAAGIGAEVVLKACSQEFLRHLAKIVIVGDAQFLLEFAHRFGLYSDFLIVDSVKELEGLDKPAVYDLKNLPLDVEMGRPSAICGKASAEYIEAAVDLWKCGVIDAVVTAPISKKSLFMAGYQYPGHTEFLAKLSGVQRVAMSFFVENLRVALLSTHLSLSDAIKLVKKENLIEFILFTNKELGKFFPRKIKIAVAGLNPHASEEGLFGREEREEIEPAVRHCRESYGLEVYGPFSPDTIFLRAFRGEFDVVIACYHDQATIAVKCLSFGKGVNVTLGLPFIRTSVDHGTAFDIAGKSVADPGSMIEAIKTAASLVLMQKEARSLT